MSKNKNIKIRIKKGDTVKVLSGNSRGKEGVVLLIDKTKYRAIVEGVNMMKKHTKPNAEYPDGGIVEKETAIHISNLMLIDPKTGTPTKVGRKKLDSGKRVRIAKKTGEIID